jgi:hypothetical protein
MKRILMSLTLLIVCCTTTSWAFDGQRKGFVMGGGLGFGPVATVKVDDFDESYTGIAINLLIGYAWDNQNMITVMRDGVVYTIDFGSDKVTVAQGFGGIVWSHYFSHFDKGGFINLGLGLQDWSSLEDEYESNDPGVGVLAGGGYEFTRHVQIYGNFSLGKTSFQNIDFSHTQLTVGVAAIAF